MANGRRQKRRPRRHRRAPRRTGFYRTGLDPKRTASWPAPARWTVFDAFDLELLTSEEYLAKTRGVRPTRVDDLPLAPAAFGVAEPEEYMPDWWGPVYFAAAICPVTGKGATSCHDSDRFPGRFSAMSPLRRVRADIAAYVHSAAEGDPVAKWSWESWNGPRRTRRGHRALRGRRES